MPAIWSTLLRRYRTAVGWEICESATNALRLHVESDSWDQFCFRLGIVVAYRCEERVEQLGGVGNEMFVVLVDGEDGEDGVLADERVSVLEA